jgi:hypothetical protein
LFFLITISSGPFSYDNDRLFYKSNLGITTFFLEIADLSILGYNSYCSIISSFFFFSRTTFVDDKTLFLGDLFLFSITVLFNVYCLLSWGLTLIGEIEIFQFFSVTCFTLGLFLEKPNFYLDFFKSSTTI